MVRNLSLGDRIAVSGRRWGRIQSWIDLRRVETNVLRSAPLSSLVYVVGGASVLDLPASSFEPEGYPNRVEMGGNSVRLDFSMGGDRGRRVSIVRV